MLKEIKKYGNTSVIVLTKEELKLRNLKIGDLINIDIKRVKAGKKK